MVCSAWRMLTRRQLLQVSASAASTAAVTLLLTPLGCTTSDYGATSTSTGTTLPGCDGLNATSSVALGHTHELCAPASDLSSPPAAGVVYTTTFGADGHGHTVALTQAQVRAIAAGQTVAVPTSTSESHAHTFSLVRVAVPTPTAPPGGTPIGGGYY
jgi:hypothetical protein